MEMYSATVEVATRVDPAKVDPDQFDEVMEQLSEHHPAISVSARGWLTAAVSLPAESLAQAGATAVRLVEAAAGAAAIAAQVMTESEFNAREGWDDLSDELTVTEAAAELGVSRQAILDRISRGTLPKQKRGKSYVIPRAALVARQLGVSAADLGAISGDKAATVSTEADQEGATP